MLPRRHKEPAMLGDECEGEDDGQYDDDPEQALRIGDARLAKSGLRGNRSDQRTQAEKEAHSKEVASIPKCDTCDGRHHAHPCPNGLARSTGFDARHAELREIRCNYPV